MKAHGRKSTLQNGSNPIAPQSVSRRRATMLALAAPLSVSGARNSAAADSPVAVLIQRTEQQAAAFMAGDMTRWIGLARPSADFTLMQPFGGAASHGFDSSPKHLSALARAFRNGDAKLEIAASYDSDDLIVLVMIERQHGEVHGLPGQDWSLRVTQVHRRVGSEWWLVHRHADPLVRPIGLERTAALARGQ